MYYENTASAGSGIMGVLICGIQLCCCMFILIGFAFWVWMLVDVIQREFPKDKENDKTMWIVIIGFLGFIGAGVYYFSVKRKYESLSRPTTIESGPVDTHA